jgi:PKD repeat protein
MNAFKTLAAALATIAVTACTVQKADEPPPLAGPSGAATSVSLTASPDSISHDGGSQSRITITVFGPDGKPFARPPSLRLDTFVNGVQADYGTLSARTVVPNGNGEAVVVYTAPPPPPGSVFPTCNGLAGTCVDIVATAIGTNFETAAPQSVLLRLIPPGVIQPPASTPTAAFTFSPTTGIAANSAVIFDASTSKQGAGATLIVDYSWTFGDGAAGTGKNITHTYGDAGSLNVTMTVTNDRGLSASTTQAITVGAGSLPEPKFTVSPVAANINEPVFFNASTSIAGAGHTIVSYRWAFGDGTPNESGVSVTHRFTAAGEYKVQLTVTDEAGQSVTSSGTGVPIGTGNPVPVITYSPGSPRAGSGVTFDAAGTTTSSGATIATYAWSFPGATPGSSATTSQTVIYAAAGSYTVRLTVTDSQGRIGSSTVQVTVVP